MCLCLKMSATKNNVKLDNGYITRNNTQIEKKSAKIEMSTNIYSWVGVKLIYHLNFNNI